MNNDFDFDKNYVLGGAEMRSLESICKVMFGDGSSLDPDKRRDTANLLRVIIDNAIELEEYE